jgi:hypothetical protein
MNSIYAKVFFCVLSVTIVAILAGVRDFEVGGVDLLLYGDDVFYYAHNSESFMNMISTSRFGIDGEYGYLFINYIVSRFTMDLHWFCFVLSFITNGVVMLAINILNRKYTVMIWLVYLFTYYLLAYNYLRQGLAVAVVFLAIVLVSKDMPIFGFIVGLSSILFHNSAVMFFLIYFIILYFKKNHSLKSYLLLVGASVFVLIFYSIIVSQLVNYNLINMKYLGYINNTTSIEPLGYEDLYRVVPLLMGFIVFRKSNQNSDININRIFYLFLIIDLIFVPIKEINGTLYRSMIYFAYIRIVLYPAIVDSIKSLSLRYIAKFGCVVFVVGIFVMKNYSSSYTSQILGIY